MEEDAQKSNDPSCDHGGRVTLFERKSMEGGEKT